MRASFLFWVVFWLAFSLSGAVADDSAMSDISGGTVQPMKSHPTIRMVNETVDIKLGEKVGREWPAFVRCEFQLRNDGAATDVTIGFPEEASSEGDSCPSMRLRGFESWVDGKKVKVSYMPVPKQKKPDADAQEGKYEAWFVKKVHFEAGQTHRVVDAYSMRLGSSNTAGEVTHCLLSYVLRTGANWKGTIESAVIRADLSPAAAYYQVSAIPPGYTRKQNTLTWTLKDLEPKEDIHVTLTPKVPLLNHKKVKGEWEPFFVRNGIVMASLQFLGEKSELHGKRVILHANGHVLELAPGSQSAVLDGKKIALKMAPWMEKTDRIKGAAVEPHDYAVPLEEVVTLLGGRVETGADGRLNVVLKQE
jgi:hypothetical protein